MAEGAPSEVESAHPEGADFESNFVISGEETNFNYAVFTLEGGASSVSSECVVVARVDSKFLVAVPEKAWHKKRLQRAIGPDALTKTVRITVAGCPADLREEPEGEPSLKVWLGLLAPSLEDRLNDVEVAEVTFPEAARGVPFIPYAAALVAVAQDHFTFLTAGETAGESGALVDQRLEKLEDGMAQILQQLKKLQASPGAGPSRPKVAPAPKAQNPRAGAEPTMNGLSPALELQALQAGVTPGALAEVSKLLGQKAASQLVPAAVPDAKELTSEEEEDAGEVGGYGSADPMGKAVLQLSKIVSAMHQDKIQKKDKGLEAILDHAESGVAKDALGGGASKTHAAALRSLQKLLLQNPQLIFAEVERLMAEDWELSGPLPGVQHLPTSARGWLEHRSKIGNYVGAIRPAWIMAGAWDNLRGGHHDRARARLALGVAAYDQQAYDRGSWLLAGELSLEPPPPYASFVSHQPPEPWESPHTRLVDSRWFDLLMSKLKSLADFQEKKLKLNPTRGKSSEEPAPKADQPKKPAPKQNGKGGGKKGGKSEEASASTTPSPTTS